MRKEKKSWGKREENHSHGVSPEDKENVGFVVTQPLTVLKDIRT